jgi:hypothetical protein
MKKCIEYILYQAFYGYFKTDHTGLREIHVNDLERNDYKVTKSHIVFY